MSLALFRFTFKESPKLCLKILCCKASLALNLLLEHPYSRFNKKSLIIYLESSQQFYLLQIDSIMYSLRRLKS